MVRINHMFVLNQSCNFDQYIRWDIADWVNLYNNKYDYLYWWYIFEQVKVYSICHLGDGRLLQQSLVCVCV